MQIIGKVKQIMDQRIIQEEISTQIYNTTRHNAGGVFDAYRIYFYFCMFVICKRFFLLWV